MGICCYNVLLFHKVGSLELNWFLFSWGITGCIFLSIEPVSAFSLANNSGHSNENPIWWRWHGNTKSHAILPFGDVWCVPTSQIDFSLWFNRYLIFKSVAVTWHGWRGTRMVAPKMAAGQYALFMQLIYISLILLLNTETWFSWECNSGITTGFSNSSLDWIKHTVKPLI